MEEVKKGRLMIRTTRQLANALYSLKDELIIVVDEEEKEYVIEDIVRRKLHMDDDKEWCYALNIRKTGEGCIKR